MTSDLNLGITHTSSPESSSEPRTPNSPMLPLPVSNENSSAHTASATTAGPPKRKPSRRANTAERRATHNAVERQRRETLNGRFLDLAALLPNLSQIRRPSKSSIVNSSIAHVHASRRHRMLASRELRSLKGEADALRRELNEWRDRANVPRIEEPTRGEGFSMILDGELEVLVVNGPLEEEDEEIGDATYPIDDAPAYAEAEEHSRFAAQQHLLKQQQQHQQQPSHPFAHQVPPQRLSLTLPAAHVAHGHGPTHMMGGPMIASPTGMSFDGPVLGAYHEQHVQGYPTGGPPGSSGGYPFNSHSQSMDEKQWGMYQQQMMQRAMSSHASSPPGSSSGLSSISAQEYNMRASGPGVPTGPIEIRGGRERSGSFGRPHYTGGSGGSPSERGSPPQFDQQQQWIMKQQQQQQQHGQPQRYGVF